MTISFGISLRSIFTLLTIIEVQVKAQIFEFDSLVITHHVSLAFEIRPFSVVLYP